MKSGAPTRPQSECAFAPAVAETTQTFVLRLRCVGDTMKYLDLRAWQVGCLLGLAIGLAQAVSGNLEIASLPIEEGIVRLVATMVGCAAFCALAAGVMTGVTSSREDASSQE